MLNLFYVALGGAIGAMLRYGAGKAAVAAFGHGFPYGTMGVNIVGSLCMGVFVGIMARQVAPHQAMHLLFAIGLFGGFTTFSSFALDAVTLIQRGEVLNAALYVAASVLLSLLALVAGLYLVRQVA